MTSLTMTQIKQKFFTSIQDKQFQQLFTNKYVIGHGQQSDVFKAIFQGKNVAIKILKTKQSTQLQGKYIQAQIECLKKCNRHPNILRLIQCYRIINSNNGHQKYCLVIQYYQSVLQGNLAIKQLPILDKFSLVQQLSNALKFIHQQKIMHRDLKPDNILVTKQNQNYKLAIADFGCSKLIGKNSQSLQGTIIGTPIYADPNVIKGIYSEKCDVYSLGLIIFYIFCGQNPFTRCKTQIQLNTLKNQYLRETDVETSRFLKKIRNLQQQIKSFLLKIARFTLKQDKIRYNSQKLDNFIKQSKNQYKKRLQKQKNIKKQDLKIQFIKFQDQYQYEVKSIQASKVYKAPIQNQIKDEYQQFTQIPLNTKNSEYQDYKLNKQNNYSNINSIDEQNQLKQTNIDRLIINELDDQKLNRQDKSNINQLGESYIDRLNEQNINQQEERNINQLDESNLNVDFSLRSKSKITTSTYQKNKSQSQVQSPIKQSINISSIKINNKKIHSTILQSQKSIYSNKQSMDIEKLRIKNKLQSIKKTQGILNQQDKLCANILQYENQIVRKFQELEIQRKILIINKFNQNNFNQVKIIQKISDNKLKLEDKKCIAFMCHYLYRHTMQVTRIFLFSGKCIDRSPFQDIPFKKLCQSVKCSMLSILQQQKLRITPVFSQVTKDLISIRNLISSKVSNQILQMLHYALNNLAQGVWGMPYSQYIIKMQFSQFVNDRVRIMTKDEDKQRLLNLLQAINDIN